MTVINQAFKQRSLHFTVYGYIYYQSKAAFEEQLIKLIALGQRTLGWNLMAEV